MAGSAQPPGALPEPLSPELALVDPVLRERAIALLPDPGPPLAWLAPLESAAPLEPVAPPGPAAPLEPVAPPEPVPAAVPVAPPPPAVPPAPVAPAAPVPLAERIAASVEAAPTPAPLRAPAAAPVGPPAPTPAPAVEPASAPAAATEAPAPRRRRLARTRRTVRIAVNVAFAAGVVWLLVFASDDSLAPRLLPAEPAAAPRPPSVSVPTTAEPVVPPAATAPPAIGKATPPAPKPSKPVLVKPKPTPKPAATPAPAAKPKPKPKPKPPATPKPKPTAPAAPAAQGPTAKTFAWGAVPNAARYRVRFLRGGEVVYATTTTEPRVVVPATWQYAGRSGSFTRGTYRWVVEAVTADGSPIVVVDSAYPVR